MVTRFGSTPTFNSRLQPTQIGLGISQTSTSVLGLDYAYDTTGSDNNGNVRTQAISLPGALFTQTYSYDQVNRLASAQERIPTKVMWIQTYGYDRWGNRTSLVNTGSHAFRLPTQSTPGVDPATNRLNDLYYTYDVAGNLRGWPGSVATYDAENRQSYYGLSAKFQYSYDGDGRRVKKVNLDGGPLVTVSSITPVAR